MLRMRGGGRGERRGGLKLPPCSSCRGGRRREERWVGKGETCHKPWVQCNLKIFQPKNMNKVLSKEVKENKKIFISDKSGAKK